MKTAAAKALLVATIVATSCARATTPPAPAPTATLPQTEPAATSTAGHPRSDLIPREILFGNPERTGAQLSPDGKWISWQAPHNGVLNVWVAPADDLANAKPVTASTKQPVFNARWTFDSKHLLYLQDAAGDENTHVYRDRVAVLASLDDAARGWLDRVVGTGLRLVGDGCPLVLVRRADDVAACGRRGEEPARRPCTQLACAVAVLRTPFRARLRRHDEVSRFEPPQDAVSTVASVSPAPKARRPAVDAARVHHEARNAARLGSTRSSMPSSKHTPFGRDRRAESPDRQLP